MSVYEVISHQVCFVLVLKVALIVGGWAWVRGREEISSGCFQLHFIFSAWIRPS